MLYIAIIGDIKDSKSYENRSEVQQYLKVTLESINKKYKKDIAAKFLITLGDEFQGLLLKEDNLFEIVRYIQKEMYPVKIRFGIGIGEIHTDIDYKAAIGADGPAYYAARQMIDNIRSQEKKLKSQAADIEVSLYDEECFDITQINTMLSLMKVIEESWTDKQRYTIWDMEENGGSQIECALRMDTTQSSVARRLADGNYITYEKTKNVVDESVKKFMERQQGRDK